MLAIQGNIVQWQHENGSILQDIWRANWRVLRNVEIFPNVKISEDIWIMPEHYTAGGAQRRLSCRKLDFQNVVPKFSKLTDEQQEWLKQATKRLVLLLQICSVRRGRGRHLGRLKPASWVSYGQVLIRVISWIQENAPSTNTVFSHLSLSQMRKVAEIGNRRWRDLVLPRLVALYDAGHFDDWPTFLPSDILEPSRKLSAAGPPDGQNSVTKKAIPDQAISSILKVATFISSELCPPAIRALEIYASLRADSENGLPKPSAFQEGISGLAGPQEWPFRLRLAGVRGPKSGWVAKWAEIPTFRCLSNLVTLCQTANWIILAFCTAARAGELAELRFNCLSDEGRMGSLKMAEESELSPVASVRLQGATSKLEEAVFARDWPLPDAAVAAVRMQQRLRRTVCEVANKGTIDRLWFGAMGKGCVAKLEFGQDLIWFVRGIEVQGRLLESFDPDQIHPHRFRHTMARLVGLSMASGVHEAFLLLGHKSIDMTLRYIRSDPELQREIMKIEAEVVYALAHQAVTGADENGGPAAYKIKDLVDRVAVRHGRDLGADTIKEAVEILTLGGGAVQMVREGVLCTKTFHDRGACTKRAGKPDASMCQYDCTHRLELSQARAAVREAIEVILRSSETWSDANPMTKAFLRKSLHEQLERFADIKKSYLSDDRVVSILNH